MSDQRNLVIAIALSLAILLGFQFLVEAPRQDQQNKALEQQKQQQTVQGGDGAITPSAPSATTDGTSSAGIAMPGAKSTAATLAANRAAALKLSKRVVVNSQRLGGSIALKGGRIDDLTMLDYKETIEENSPAVTLLSPHQSPNP